MNNLTDLAQHFKARLVREGDLEPLLTLPRPALRLAVAARVAQLVSEERVILARAEQERLIALICDEAAGFGPLEPLLVDPAVTEIMVVAADEVYAEREGTISPAEVRFRDAAHIRHIIERIIAPIGRRIDESSPMVDARLPDGSRVNAVIPPVALNGPVITIRKFRAVPMGLDDLIAGDSLSPAMAAFLRAAVLARLNIVISGGTGSGKTTLLGALASEVPARERLVTVEDMAELRLARRHVVALEARPANAEGRGEITIHQLMRNALRMRPDRIIVGEVRGDEALDMLQAMNTGHEGSLTTIHANSAADAFARLEAMVVLSGAQLPVHVIREHLVGALDLVLQTERLSDGRRKLVAIAEVLGIEGGHIQVCELFRFDRQGLASDGRLCGRFVAAGRLPASWPLLQRLAVAPAPDLFGVSGKGASS